MFFLTRNLLGKAERTWTWRQQLNWQDRTCEAYTTENTSDTRRPLTNAYGDSPDGRRCQSRCTRWTSLNRRCGCGDTDAERVGRCYGSREILRLRIPQQDQQHEEPIGDAERATKGTYGTFTCETVDHDVDCFRIFTDTGGVE